MKKSLVSWQILGFIFTSVMGVALHFLFDLTNQSILVAPFSAVNESIWEHMKLLFFPMLIFTVIESRYLEYENFWCVKLIGIVSGTALIPILYYTIIGIFGTIPDFVNILIFFVTTAFSYLLETRLMKSDMEFCTSKRLSVTILLLIAIIFALFTFRPPHIPFFKDPISNTYGYYQTK